MKKFRLFRILFISLSGSMLINLCETERSWVWTDPLTMLWIGVCLNYYYEQPTNNLLKHPFVVFVVSFL